MGTSVGSALWIYSANLTNFTNLAFMGECHECIDYQQCIMGTSVGSALWIYSANLTNLTNLAFLAYT